MVSITIRRLDDGVKAKLRLRAASHGRSMEEEACEILRTGLSAKRGSRLNLAESIRRHIEPLGGVELTLPPRQAVRRRPQTAKKTRVDRGSQAGGLRHYSFAASSTLG